MASRLLGKGASSRPLGLTVAVEVAELLQVAAQLGWEVSTGLVQVAERGDRPAAW